MGGNKPSSENVLPHYTYTRTYAYIFHYPVFDVSVIAGACGRAGLIWEFDSSVVDGAEIKTHDVTRFPLGGPPCWLITSSSKSFLGTFFIFFFTPPRNRGGLYFHFNLSVCLCRPMCVCVCLSVSPSVNKMPIDRIHQFECGFRYMAAYCTGLIPIEIGDLGSKVKVTVT